MKLAGRVGSSATVFQMRSVCQAMFNKECNDCFCFVLKQFDLFNLQLTANILIAKIEYQCNYAFNLPKLLLFKTNTENVIIE